MKTKSLIVLVLILFLFTACEEGATGEDSGSSVAPSDGSQNASQLAGTGVACQSATGTGSVFGSKNYRRSLALNANGSYSYDVRFALDNTTCITNKIPDGSQEVLVYSQSGTFAVNGIAATPSDATKITFTPLAATLTIRSTMDSGTLATYMNTCSYSQNFPTNADSTKTMNGNVCNPSGSYAFGDFPVLNSPIYNIIQKAGTLRTGSRINIWNPGAYTQGGVATSYSVTYYY